MNDSSPRPCWRTPDGGLLVEREAAQGDKRYVLFDAAGAVADVFEAWGSSDQEYLYSMTYDVEGSSLVEHTHEEVDSGRESHYPSRVPLHGLIPVADGRPPADDVEQAVALFKDRRNRRAGEEEVAREARRPRTLPHLAGPPGGEPFDVELFEEGEDVVARLAGAELWREPRTGWSDGREVEVRGLLSRRFGGRFRRLVARFTWDAR